MKTTPFSTPVRQMVIHKETHIISAILPYDGWFEPADEHRIVYCHWSLERDLKVGDVFPVKTNKERIGGIFN